MSEDKVMHHLFSAAGERALAQLLQGRPLLAFDFDGTLAAIVARPEDAQVSTGIARRLADLARRAPVAVVTGRSIADARPRLGFEPAYLVGNHGAEGLAWEGQTEGLQQLRERLRLREPELRLAGVQLEDKGLSLALHYRLARDRALAQRVIDDLLADLPAELKTFGGKCVLNVVARAAPDKGDAVLALLRHSGCESLLFVGDDINDEAVFERAEPHWLTVRIGPDHGESRAMYFLAAHAEMASLLEKMQHNLSSSSSPP